MPGKWGGTPFAALAPVLALGVGLARCVDGYEFTLLALGTAILACSALVALARDRLVMAQASALFATAASGFALGVAQRDAFPADDIRALLGRSAFPLEELLEFDGCVADEVERAPGFARAHVELDGLRVGPRWIRARGGAELRIAETAGGDAPALRYGDRVRGWAHWTLPRNFENPGSADRAGLLARRGIGMIGRVKSPRVLEIVPGACQTSWKRTALAAREAFRARLDRLRTEGRDAEAAVLASVVIGDYSDLEPATRAVFQNTGTYHVLVVSGLHVGWISWVLIALLGALGVSAAARSIAAGAAIAAYALVVGWQASISRCLAMFLLVLGARALFRRAEPANVVLASAFVLLVAAPDWLADVGFQLSFLAVLAIVLVAVPLHERALRPVLEPLAHAGLKERVALEPGPLWRAGRKLRVLAEIAAEAVGEYRPSGERLALAAARLAARAGFFMAGMVAVSLAVELWLGPTLAYYFNRLSWIAPAANLVVVPLSSLVLALGLAAAAGSLLGPGDLLFGLAAASARLLVEAAQLFAAIPGAWERCPTPPGPWVGGALALAAAGSAAGLRRLWVPAAAVAMLLAALRLGAIPVDPPVGRDPRLGAAPTSVLRLTFLDVGQGDAIVLELPDGRVSVVDAGGLREPSSGARPPRFDVGEAIVSRFLWSRGVRALDRLVLSHPHYDHAGGMPALVENFAVRELAYADAGPEPAMRRLLVDSGARAGAIRVLRAGDSIPAAGVTIETLNPPRDGPARSVNDNSVVLRVRYGRFAALLTGDLERAGEEALLARGVELESALLKVAHHGSRSATLDRFLARVRPRWGVLSAGRSNPFGHPSPEVLARLIRRGARPLSTLELGAITLTTDGARFVLETWRCGVLEQGELR